MFRSVGQVMHLLEDTSQPQHVRDEQHLDMLFKLNILSLRSRSAIEDWGNKHVASLNYTHSILDWRGIGFTKLEDFWNTYQYNGSAAALQSAESGGAQLGLAEWCNGNFLAQRATYAEFFGPNDLRHFPFPSLANTTQPNLQQGNLWGTATHGDVTLENFKQGTRLYISKTGAGVPITYHSALSYLIAQHPGKSGGMPILTIADDNVLLNYHNLLIPKAVKYSTGLIDYYFRGQLDACVGFGNWKYIGNDRVPQMAAKVTNISGTNLFNGTFTVLAEDSDGTRTIVGTNALQGSLDDGAVYYVDFTPTNAVNYFVVYQGTIGATGSSALDPVDAGIAIAVQQFTIPQDSDEVVTADEWNNGIPTDVGQFVGVGDAGQLGTMPAGLYQAHYMGGHASAFSPAICNQRGSGYCEDCTVQYYYTKTSWMNGIGEAEQRCPDSSCIWDNRPSTADAGRVEQETSTNSFVFCHPGGPFGPVVGQPIVCQNGDVDETPTDEGGTFDPGHITYSVQQMVFPQITNSTQFSSITVNLNADVLSQLFPCSWDLTNSSLPTWDGELTQTQEDDCSGYFEWSTDDPTTGYSGVSINGFEVSAYVYTATGLPTKEGVGWRLEIWVKDPDGDDDLLWSGCKSQGYSPKGTYLFDEQYNEDFEACAPDICSITVQ